MVQQLNRFAWIITALAGVGFLAYGAWYLFVWVGVGLGSVLPSLTAYGVYYLIAGILGIIAGLAARVQCVPKVSSKDYSGSVKPLLIWGIVGVFSAGGLSLLLELVLIKLGKL